MTDASPTRRVLDTAEIRSRLGISQPALAEIAHVDQSSISLWEAEKTAPSRAAEALILQHCLERNVGPAWKYIPEKKNARAA